MAKFLMGLESDVLGRMLIPYEIDDADLPKVIKALGRRFGEKTDDVISGGLDDDGNDIGPQYHTRDKTPRELMRQLTDDIMRRELDFIQRTLADIEAEKARETVADIPVQTGDPVIEAPANSSGKKKAGLSMMAFSEEIPEPPKPAAASRARSKAKAGD